MPTAKLAKRGYLRLPGIPVKLEYQRSLRLNLTDPNLSRLFTPPIFQAISIRVHSKTSQADDSKNLNFISYFILSTGTTYHISLRIKLLVTTIQSI